MCIIRRLRLSVKLGFGHVCRQGPARAFNLLLALLPVAAIDLPPRAEFAGGAYLSVGGRGLRNHSRQREFILKDRG